LLWLLGGCDQLFQIHEVGSSSTDPDGGNGDSLVNAECPAIGAGPPVFRMGLREIVPRECYRYTTTEDASLASAMCNETASFTLEQGPVGGMLVPVTITSMPSNETVVAAWLAPEGDVLVTRQYQMGTASVTHRIATYKKSGAGWTFDTEIFADPNFATAGVPSRGPNRRVFVTQVVGASYREFEQQGDTWTLIEMGLWSEFGLPTGGIASSAQLSTDGLRLVFVNGFDVYYTDRTSLDAPWSMPIRIEGIGNGQDAFLTADCARIYFSANNSVFFRELQQ
jgi:hypothetical protein